ncbi:MerR family transcriptional regulator [Actinoplanes sp. NPDC049802]|uniref:MerR family transcriptional regulator n=1 Tax=Actinoplanes sp. NPDC049802 TaxID=3154742 RepID=UPI0033E16CDC
MKSSIGDLAARFGLPAHVLRHWEQMGLLAPERAGNGRRLYGDADAARIVLIQLAKEAGLSLEQTRLLLTDARDRKSRRDLYAAHAEALRKRIASAQAALALVEHAAECDADDFTACPHLAAKVAARL